MIQRDIDTAYYAGIVDGEGSVGYISSGAGRARRLAIEVKMTDRCVIDGLHRHFNAGYVARHPPHKAHYKEQWRWRVTNRAARAVLEELRPYLKIKAEPKNAPLF